METMGLGTALPAPLLIAASACLMLVAILLLRVISNRLPGKTPPVLEGVPFIGGIMKFVSVSG